MITPSFHPSIGGVETHVRRVSECLSARGHDLTVLTHSSEAAPSSEQLGPLAVCRLPRTNWWQAWRAARPHISNADIVHCHDAYSFLHFYLPSCYLTPRRPVFITYHGYEGYPLRSEAIRWRRFTRRRVRDAICMGDFMCHWYGTPCFAVSYGGVDVDPAGPPPLPERPSAVFVGRLAEDTSIMLYLYALALLKQDHGQRLPLTVVGDGPLRGPAQLYARAQHLDVTFRGVVADPTAEFARASIAFVSGYLAIWQALSLGRLVFAVYENELKRDYLSSFPRASETMVIAGEADELAAQLDRHLRRPAEADQTRTTGLQLAAEHPWDGVADLYLSMYRTHGLT